MIRDMKKLKMLSGILQKRFREIKKKQFIKTESYGMKIERISKDSEGKCVFKFTPIASDEPSIIVTAGNRGELISAKETE